MTNTDVDFLKPAMPDILECKANVFQVGQQRHLLRTVHVCFCNRLITHYNEHFIPI